MGLYRGKIFKRKTCRKHGQTLIEISMIMMIVTMALVAMTPFFKRAVQGAIKVAADQVGNQGEAEQDFDTGYTTFYYSAAHRNKQNQRGEEMGDITYTLNDRTETQSQQEMYMSR